MPELLILGMPLGLVASFAFASFLIEMTPGPNMTYLAIVAISRGRTKGFATVFGVALGLAIIGFAAAMGVTAIIQSSRTLYEILRWAGIAFLLYLAFDGWQGDSASDFKTGERQSGMRTYFRRGLLTNLLNPKAAAFYVTVLPTFLPVDASLNQSFLLTAVYVSVATFVHLMIVVLAGSLSPLLSDPGREKIARRVLSLLLALVAVWFAIGTAR